MVSGVILFLIMAAFMQFFSGALKGQKNVQNAVDFDILKSSLTLVFNSKACDGAFQTKAGLPIDVVLPAGQLWSTLVPGTNIIGPTSPLPVYQIKHGGAPIISIDPAVQTMGGGTTISKLQLTNAIYDGDRSIGTTVYKSFAATLLVEVSKQSGSYGGMGYSKLFGLRILVNPVNASSGPVEKCSPSTPASAFGAIRPCAISASISSPPQIAMSDTVAIAHCDVVASSATLIGYIDGQAVLKNSGGNSSTSLTMLVPKGSFWKFDNGLADQSPSPCNPASSTCYFFELH